MRTFGVTSAKTDTKMMDFTDFLAGSIHTNPVIIRKILTQLKAAGLISVARGTGGITVNRPLDEITFYDVYQAIEPLENGDLFHFHEGAFSFAQAR